MRPRQGVAQGGGRRQATITDGNYDTAPRRPTAHQQSKHGLLQPGCLVDTASTNHTTDQSRTLVSQFFPSVVFCCRRLRSKCSKARFSHILPQSLFVVRGSEVILQSTIFSHFINIFVVGELEVMFQRTRFTLASSFNHPHHFLLSLHTRDFDHARTRPATAPHTKPITSQLTASTALGKGSR